MQLNLQPEMIEDIFREAIHHLGRNKRKHNISMHLEDDLLMANMDARLIIQVLVNLINNAIKYTHENSNISLNARRVEDKILIEVQDDGMVFYIQINCLRCSIRKTIEVEIQDVAWV